MRTLHRDPVSRGPRSARSREASQVFGVGQVARLGRVRLHEILVDLMKTGCGVTYAEAISDAVWHEIGGVRIPFASPQALWRMKQTRRDKDIPDRLFLEQLLKSRGSSSHVTQARFAGPRSFREWLNRLFLSGGK